ncbi:hypothetical protein ACKWTF_005959 [Chironomus riparius]
MRNCDFYANELNSYIIIKAIEFWQGTHLLSDTSKLYKSWQASKDCKKIELEKFFVDLYFAPFRLLQLSFITYSFKSLIKRSYIFFPFTYSKLFQFTSFSIEIYILHLSSPRLYFIGCHSSTKGYETRRNDSLIYCRTYISVIHLIKHFQDIHICFLNQLLN